MANIIASINSLTQQLTETNAKLNQAINLTAKLEVDPANSKGNCPKSPKIVTFNKYY